MRTPTCARVYIRGLPVALVGSHVGVRTIDTQKKRKSIAAIGQRHVGPAVFPNAVIDQADRQVVGYSYSGILAGGAGPAANALHLVNNIPLTVLVNGTLVA